MSEATSQTGGSLLAEKSGGAVIDTPLSRLLGPIDGKLCKDLLAWAWRRTGHAEDAEDVFALGRVRALENERNGAPWDPDGEIVAFTHTVKYVRGALADHWKTAKRRRREPMDDPDAFASRVPGVEDAARLDADDRMHRAMELHQKLVAEGKDPIAIETLGAVLAGVTAHPEIAERVKCTVNEVRAALKRLATRAQPSVDEYRQKQKQSMKDGAS